MYFPKSQITPNLYTNGGEYAYASNKKEYKGYYWRLATGKVYTGKTPQDPPVELLIPITQEDYKILGPTIEIYDGDYDGLKENNITQNYDEIGVKTYSNLKSININQKFLIPVYNPSIPTQQDYQVGEYRRYFCKKTNETIYLEINKDTYDKLINKNPEIYFQYYQPFNIPWRLIGSKEQVYTTNKNIVELTMKQQKLPMFDLYIKKDYTKYYK